jgi:hypothetical protein
MKTFTGWLRRKLGNVGRDYYTYSPTHGWRHHAAGRLTSKAAAPPDAPLPPNHPDRDEQIQEWVEHHEVLHGETPKPAEVVELPPEKE